MGSCVSQNIRGNAQASDQGKPVQTLESNSLNNNQQDQDNLVERHDYLMLENNSLKNDVQKNAFKCQELEEQVLAKNSALNDLRHYLQENQKALNDLRHSLSTKEAILQEEQKENQKLAQLLDDADDKQEIMTTAFEKIDAEIANLPDVTIGKRTNCAKVQVGQQTVKIITTKEPNETAQAKKIHSLVQIYSEHGKKGCSCCYQHHKFVNYMKCPRFCTWVVCPECYQKPVVCAKQCGQCRKPLVNVLSR